ncbi:hypothetical protein C8T65DRAFT_692242 [Cerioporus squamosus]|nr:hypothetical protein C8T65DRAFT_692242 [Cerioporus squamosus]
MSRPPPTITSDQPNRPATPRTYFQRHTQDQATIWNAAGHQMNHTVPAPHQISRESSLAPNTLRWEILPLDSYAGGRGQGTGGAVEFVRISRQPLLLTDALHEACPDLRDAECPAPLGNVSTKLSIRIPFPGAKPYHRQIMARRSTTNGEHVSLKVLARKIAKEMKEFIAQTPLMYRNMPVRLDRLALLGFQNISDGSWVPVFMIYTLPDPHPGPAT